MSKTYAKIRGLGFIVWHSKHEFTHFLLGLAWAWFLREWWGEFSTKWIVWALIGSVLPDIDHFLYWLVYGNKDPYSKEVKKLFREKKWRSAFLFVEHNHKYQTNLISHNYFAILIMLTIAVFAWILDWEIGVILFGSMIIHYVFDIVDDILTLGYINPNWKRLGRLKEPKVINN